MSVINSTLLWACITHLHGHAYNEDSIYDHMYLFSVVDGYRIQVYVQERYCVTQYTCTYYVFTINSYQRYI